MFFNVYNLQPALMGIRLFLAACTVLLHLVNYILCLVNLLIIVSVWLCLCVWQNKISSYSSSSSRAAAIRLCT